MAGLLALNLLLQLEQVLLPGVEGYFGVKANHVPIIAQLKPGVVELHEGTEVTKYFVSGGFAFVHPNSVTDICVLEAATLDQFDSTAVKTALTVRTGFGRRMQLCSLIAAETICSAEKTARQGHSMQSAMHNVVAMSIWHAAA